LIQETPIPADEVARALERVLARAEFHERPGLLDELADWITDHLRIPFPPETMRAVLWGLVGVGAVILVVLLLRFFAAGRAWRSAAEEERAASGPDLAARVAALRRAAREARARGELALALRHGLHALVLGMGGRGALEFREAWTNRELLTRGRPSPEAHATLQPLVDEIEAKEYGGRATTDADVDRVEEQCERFLGGAAADAAEAGA